MIDYEILKAIWWLFIGVLLVGFTIMDGQDMGVGTLLPFLGKNDSERRIMINSVAPHWDGNQVWFVTGGGAMFAAWPLMYAIAFSGFYWLLTIAVRFQPNVGARLGTGFCLLAPPCRRSSAVSHLAICFRACLLKLIRRCVRFIPAASSDCSTRSDFSAASFQL